jgi:hypothetical protein
MTSPIAAALPLRRDLTAAYASSLAVAFAFAVASIAGLVLGSDGLYDPVSPLVQVSRGGDAANLLLGLPVLLGSMWLARRGSLIGLLLWPGALFYALYADALYLVGAPLSGLFFLYVAVVTLSAWTLIGIVASIDAEEVRRRLAMAPARSVGVALVLIAVLAYVGLTAAVSSSLGSPSSVVGMRPQWVVDYALGTPVLLLGGALLWRRMSLGYVATAGLLLVSGLNGLAFAASALLDWLLTGRAFEPAVLVVHLVIGAVSLGLLAYFERGAIGRAPVVRSGVSSRPGETAGRAERSS